MGVRATARACPLLRVGGKSDAEVQGEGWTFVRLQPKIWGWNSDQEVSIALHAREGLAATRWGYIINQIGTRYRIFPGRSIYIYLLELLRNQFNSPRLHLLQGAAIMERYLWLPNDFMSA